MIGRPGSPGIGRMIVMFLAQLRMSGLARKHDAEQHRGRR